MKRVWIFIIVLIAAVAGVSQMRQPAGPFVCPPLAERQKMSEGERLKVLERNGMVPADADLTDRTLAQRATWWGKRISAEEFWRGKVVWLDEEAISAASRQGRQWPPIPFKDPKIESLFLDDTDVRPRFAYAGGGYLQYVYSYKEDAFWQMFSKQAPKPPKRIREKQLDLARALLSPQKEPAATDLYAKKVAEVQQKGRQLAKAREIEKGFPPEALTDEALFATWALTLRKEYQRLLETGHKGDSVAVKTLLFQWPFDSKVITDSNAQPVDENSWKIEYLQRLRREKVDESYIQAYLKAWNLTEQQVFEGEAK